MEDVCQYEYIGMN